jgi:TolB-like protein/DNA-binding winged helix-turn-helix (wHTH) protein/Tfp pilus assembly protein PilF
MELNTGGRGKVFTRTFKFPDKILTPFPSGLCMPTDASSRRIYEFGDWRVDPDEHLLLRQGNPVPLTPKVFQTLVILVENAGRLVPKDEFMRRVWPDAFVEEAALAQNISLLRKTLATSATNGAAIETVPKRGYRLLAAVRALEARDEGASAASAPSVASATVSPRDETGIASQGIAATHPRRQTGTTLVIVYAGLALLLLALSMIYVRWRSHGPRAGGPVQVHSIAVLPLENLSNGPAQDYFADGMTDEIITDLARLAGPKVISHTSVVQYKGTRKTIHEIAGELHVGAVLEGSVERSGDRMRVRVQLIEASSDQHLWAEAYDRQLGDVLLLEADLAQDIARQIELRLTPQQQQNLARNRTLNPQAFQDYLQGRHYWALRSSQSVTTAIGFFNRAIQEDPNDARSYAGLAQCYIVLPMVAKTSQSEAYQKARDAATKALALDDSLAEAHLSIGEVRLYGDWDFAGAEKEFKKTLELNPNYSTGHQWYGEFLSLMARHEEAIRELQTALALDPFSAIVHLQFGNTLQQARQYDQALDQYHEALKIDANLSLPFNAMHWVYRRQGKFAESIAPLRLALQSWDAKNDWIALVDQLPAAYSTGGRTGYLRQCIKIHERSERPWLYLARDYADLGDREKALTALNKSYENRHLEVLWLLVDPELDPLRSDPRFQELVRKVGFPQPSS